MIAPRLNNSEERTMKKTIPDDLRIVVATITILRSVYLQQLFIDSTSGTLLGAVFL